MPAVVGQTVGVLITNVTSPLGPIDMINTVPSFLCSLLIWKLRRVSVLLGFLIYTITLGFTVSWILSSVLNIPFLQSFVFVTAGIGFVVILIGYTFYRALLKAGVERYFG
jgi:FtsH-binding integral membrane protein